MLKDSALANSSTLEIVQSQNSLLVDDHRHARLAVLALTAVQPDRAGAVDHDGEGRDLTLGGAGSDGHEARVDTEDARVDRRDGRARIVKVGLSDSVVAGTELELDHGANRSGDSVRREGQRVVLARDIDDLDVDTCLRSSSALLSASTLSFF